MESRPHGLPLLAEQSAARDHSQHETTRRGTARGPGNGSRHSRRRTLAEARFLVQELRLQADLPGTRRVFERPGILLTVFFRLKAKRRRSSESKESLFVPLRSRNCSSLLAIHSVDPRERVAPRLAHPAAFCQPHQRLLWTGRTGFVRGRRWIHSHRRAPARRTPALVANPGAVHRRRLLRAASLSLSARRRVGRKRSPSQNLSQCYR